MVWTEGPPTPPTSKVDLCAAIRRDSRAALAVRALARKYRISRRTVRSALSPAWPAPRELSVCERAVAGVRG
ncbi:hypothetical protein GCM10018962_72750 [Dactylosporangium matsuzakiense]|uniref:HTH domain-containing protein n=1 Tax=Dactylosporangium matsuzakiense TaxID=53360 RepID=A0A9W6NNR6_9ACTN|nr:hypothetical protein GCM10017581_052540 [Dactylosporangium matsuzakiense]